MIFDTHAHYSDEQFDKDRDELLWGMEDEGVGTIVEIGASMESSREAIRLAEQYPFVYASEIGRASCRERVSSPV